MPRLIISLLFFMSLHAVAEPSRYEQALLWRITANQQSAPGYLFGTIHSEDSRVLDLPLPVSNALRQSSHFVMEIVPGTVASEQVHRRMALPAGQTLASLLEPELYNATEKALMTHGIPAGAAERIRPWAVVMILNMPKPETGLYLDQMLHDIAAAQGKRISGLETVDEQIDALDGLSMEMQIVLLRHTIEQLETIPQFTGSLIDAWLRRDLDELWRLGEVSSEGIPGEVERVLHSRLLDERNIRMAERLTPMLKQGGVFAAVGALHLPGEQGLIALLRQKGFKVEPVY